MKNIYLFFIVVGMLFFSGCASKKAGVQQYECIGKTKKQCIKIGKRYINTKGNKEFIARGRVLLQRLCDENLGEACKELGYSYYFGTKSKENLEKGLIAFEKACKDENLHKLDRPCHMIPTMKNEIQNAKKHFSTQDLESSKFACEKGDMVNCSLLAYMYDEKRDFDNSFKIYNKLCKHGSLDGCRNLGIAHASAYGTLQDEQKGYNILKLTCQKGDIRSCQEQANMLRDGRGVAQNPKQAYKIYQYTCDNGQPSGCFALSQAFQKSNNAKMATHFFKKGVQQGEALCNKKYADACIALGSAFEAKKDAKTALKYYKKACDTNNATGCFLYDVQKQQLGL